MTTTTVLTPATQCTVGTMAVSASMGSGLVGGGLGVQIYLVAHQPCVIDRVPHVSVLQADGALVTDAAGLDYKFLAPLIPVGQPLPSPARLAAGQTFEIDGMWGDVCATVTQPVRVRVALADLHSIVVGAGSGPDPVGLPRCLSSPTTVRRLPSGSLTLGPLDILGTDYGIPTP